MSDSEALIQQRVRIACSQRGWRVWRNNVGVLRDERGVPVRYGLANESSAMNQQYKSSDLIGIKPVLITEAHIGQTLGVFVALECKREGWHYTGTPREVAQKRWIDMVRSIGGVAGFVSDADAIDTAVNKPHNAGISTAKE